MSLYTKTLKITGPTNNLIRKLLDDRAASYKNWIVSAVEQENFEYAKQLTAELAEVTALFHTFVPSDMFKTDGER